MDEFNPSITFSANNVDEAVIKVMDNLVSNGKIVNPAKNSNNPHITRELENFQFAITNPMDRISVNPYNPLDVISSVGRFAWLLAANDRLEDIAFYQNKVRDFSDDGLTIPGSNYGKRIFNPSPGIDQIKNVIELLREDPNSRRAIIPIWDPQDSSRLKSKDISCAFGMSFLIRNNELHSTLIMRSNYGLRLLPINIFEFTLIAEIVARELEIEYSKHTHSSISMHIYEEDVPKVEKWLKPSIEFIQSNSRIIMPKMPTNKSPFEQAKLLAKLEGSLRTENILRDVSHIWENLDQAKNVLDDDYWFQFFKVLSIGALVHVKEINEASNLAKDLPNYFKGPVTSYLNNFQQNIPKISTPATLDPFLSIKRKGKFSKIRESFAPDNEEIKNIIDVLHDEVEKYEDEKKISLSGPQYRKLEKKYLNRFVVAARSTGKDDNAEDLRKISQKEIRDDIKDVLSER